MFYVVKTLVISNVKDISTKFIFIYIYEKK